MAKCATCEKTTFGGIRHQGNLFCSKSCKESFKGISLVICGKCGTENPYEEKSCIECGDYLHQYKEKQVTAGASSFLKKIGALLLIGGLLVCGYFLLFFDPSVPTAFGRVVNLNLLQERQNAILIGSVSSVCGLIMFLFGAAKK